MQTTLSQPLNLSVCMIVRNEAAFLARCLKSLEPLGAQIIVVDTGSVDESVQVAEAAGAEVLHFEWCDDFSAPRNLSLSRATREWIIVLDADEELPPGSVDSLRAEMANPKAAAYRLPYIQSSSPQEGCHYVPRLFRNVPGVHYSGRVHEQVFHSIEAFRKKEGMEILLGRTPVIHHGYSLSPEKMQAKSARNMRLIQMDLLTKPNDVNLLMNHGLELTRSGKPEAGLEQYRKAFDQMAALEPGRIVPELREALLVQISSRLFAAGRYEEVIARLTNPVSLGLGLSASLHFILGMAFFKAQRVAEAAEHFDLCIANKDETLYGPPLPQLRTGIPFHCLAFCFARMGRVDQAAQAFQNASALSPGDKAILIDLARFALHVSRPAIAQAAFERWTREHPEDADAQEVLETIRQACTHSSVSPN